MSNNLLQDDVKFERTKVSRLEFISQVCDAIVDKTPGVPDITFYSFESIEPENIEVWGVYANPNVALDFIVRFEYDPESVSRRPNFVSVWIQKGQKYPCGSINADDEGCGGVSLTNCILSRLDAGAHMMEYIH